MKKKKMGFSKVLLLLESAIVLYTTYQGLRDERCVLLRKGKGGKYERRRDV